jgi:hypothetical protein
MKAKDFELTLLSKLSVNNIALRNSQHLASTATVKTVITVS